MTYNIILSAIAENEISSISDWYDQQNFPSGENFILTLEDMLARIVWNPKIYPIVLFGEYRRALLRRFPYAIWFRIDGNNVKVSSVFHTSRSPEILYKRLH